MNDMLHGLDYTSYFHLSDFKFYYRNGFTDVPNYFGLLTFDQPVRRKPSYGVMQRICTLFDGETELVPCGLVEFSIRDFSNSPERYRFQEDIAAAKCGTFLRNGSPMAVWWQPSDLLPSVSGNELRPPRTINVHVWTPQGVIEDPVVVDPITGEVFEPEHRTNDICAGVDTGIQILADVPLKDTTHGRSRPFEHRHCGGVNPQGDPLMGKMGLLLLVAICAGLCFAACAEAMGFPVSTKHLRIVGYGNSTSLWNNITEVSFYGPGLSMAGVEVSARSDDGNSAEGTLDGNPGSSWVAHDMGQWIRYDFAEKQSVSGVDMAFSSGDKRRAYIAVEVSDNGESWRRILYGTASGKKHGAGSIHFH